MAKPSSLVRVVIGAILILGVEAALLAIGLGDPAQLVRDPRAITLLAVWTVAGLWMSVGRTRGLPAPVRAEPDPLPMLGLIVVPLLTPALGALAGRYALAMPPHANTVSWCGVGTVAAGLWLRAAAMARLGARFSPLVAMQQEHALETGGPYAWVRHPGYTGALLSGIGSAVAFGSLAALPLVVPFYLAMRARIRREEVMLASQFGGQWAAYAARTGALLPRFGRSG